MPTKLFASENICFKGEPQSKGRLGCDDPKSCQGSSIVWCGYALNGEYNKNPHDNKKEVWNVQESIDPQAKWTDKWNWMTQLYDEALMEGLKATKSLQKQGGVGNNGDAPKMLGEICKLWEKGGVILIASDCWHVTAAAFANGVGYYYDNDVGCYKCDSEKEWKTWVEKCDVKCRGNYWSKTKPKLMYMQIVKTKI